MSTGLRAFLTGILDFAGLFPPACLPLEQAVASFAHYRGQPDAWMLRNFICPATRLAELGTTLAMLPNPGSVWTVSALGRGGNDSDEFLRGLREDIRAVHAFQRDDALASVNTFETRLPSGTDFPGEAVREITEGLPDVRLYLELPDGDREKVIAVVLDLKAINARRDTANGTAVPRIGLKLRCGGLEASAFPSAERVALVIATCRDAAVPLKFTAGLHHPIRRYDANLNTPMHGFLNIFAAGILAHALRLSEAEIQAVVEDDNAADFAFDDTGFHWRHRCVPVSDVSLARENAVTSFGSCSFDEPRDDLRSLGLL